MTKMQPGFVAFLLTALLILGGCNNNPIAAEQQAILQRIDKSVEDLKPIEPRAGSVCDDLYVRKVYYDEVCGTYEKMGETSSMASSSDTRIAVRMLVLPTFGRPAGFRFELASSNKGAVTVRQLSRHVLRDNLSTKHADAAWSSPFAEGVRMPGPNFRTLTWQPAPNGAAPALRS